VLLVSGTLLFTLPRARAAPDRDPATGRVRSVLRDLREGWDALASSPLLRGLTIMIGMWALAAGTFWGIGVVYALDEWPVLPYPESSRGPVPRVATVVTPRSMSSPRSVVIE
jgi:hypothetical protein